MESPLKEVKEEGLQSGVGIRRSGWTFQLILSVLVVTLGSFNFGYNISVINAPSTAFLNCGSGASRWTCFPVTEGQWGLVVSIMSIGAMIGSLGTGSLASKFGRRACLIAVNLPYLLGAGLLFFSFNLWMLLAGRLAVGLGIGASCIVVPMFLSEICSLSNRGQITSAHQLMISIGLVFAELFALTGLSWRISFGLVILPALGQLIGMLLFVPESPRYLAQIGDVHGAMKSLRFFRQTGYDPLELDDMIVESSKQEHEQVVETWGFMKLLRNWSVAGKSLTAAVLLHVAQQFSGINVVFYFSSILFKTGDGGGSSTIPAAISMLNFIMTIVAIWLVEKAGRRPLTLFSCAGMVIAGIVFTACYILHVRVVSVIAILAYVASFAVGMGPIPWLMMNEIFPTQALAPAVSLAVATNWTCNFAIGVSFDWIKSLLGSWLFLPYTLCTLAFLGYALVAIPETKGRPLGFL